MHRFTILTVGALLCLALVCACETGDEDDPGTPKNFRFICDSNIPANSCNSPNTRLLAWTASGDDGDDGRAIQYDIRWALKAMTDTVYESAHEFKGEPEPRSSGAKEVLFLPRLHPGEDLSFGIQALDEVARKSEIAKTDMVKLDFIESGLDGSDSSASSTVHSDSDYGATTALLDNIDGRAKADVAVGAPGAVSPFTGENGGSVSVFLAISRGNLMSGNGDYPAAGSIGPATVIYGDATDDGFGEAINGRSDFNGDGVKDFVVGAPGADMVYVFFGGSKGRLKLSALERLPDTPVAERASSVADVIIKGPLGSSFGHSVALVGNVNGVKGSELVIGAPAINAPSTVNKAYIFYGGLKDDYAINGTSPVTVDISAGDMADWELEGPAGSGFGKSVARIYNLDGIGRDEIAIGAPAIENVFVFYGGTRSGLSIDFTATGGWLWTYNGSNYDLLLQGPVGTGFGEVLGGRGNPAGNLGSIVVGAPGAGKVYVIHGGENGALSFPTASSRLYDVVNGADWTMSSTVSKPPYAGFGKSISMQTDLDGNGRVDILVGAPDADSEKGAVFAFYSKSDTPSERSSSDADYKFYGKTNGARFGASVSGIFNPVTHSGLLYAQFDDFIVGAPGANEAVVKY